LTARARGSAEIAATLQMRGFRKGAIREAVERLTRERWLDDLAAARAAVRGRSRRYGRRRIERELEARGFSKETIAAALSDVDAAGEESTLTSAFRKLWKASARLPLAKRRRTVWAALVRRGFAQDRISAMMKGSDEVDGSSGEIP
jgi:regulatory protein